MLKTHFLRIYITQMAMSFSRIAEITYCFHALHLTIGNFYMLYIAEIDGPFSTHGGNLWFSFFQLHCDEKKHEFKQNFHSVSTQTNYICRVRLGKFQRLTANERITWWGSLLSLQIPYPPTPPLPVCPTPLFDCVHMSFQCLCLCSIHKHV
jgi:hypothetical protein